MKIKVLILMIGALVLGAPVNAADEIGLTMQIQSPQTSTMDVGVDDATYMTAVLRPMVDVYAGGRMLNKAWYDNKENYRESFVAMVGVQVPSKIPGFATLKEAMNADVRISISNNGVAFAECLLAVEPVTSRSAVHFAVDLASFWDEVKPNKGICDVDLKTPGLQVGIPVLSYKDRLTALVRGKPYKEFEFLEGYCY